MKEQLKLWTESELKECVEEVLSESRRVKSCAVFKMLNTDKEKAKEQLDQFAAQQKQQAIKLSEQAEKIKILSTVIQHSKADSVSFKGGLAMLSYKGKRDKSFNGIAAIRRNRLSVIKNTMSDYEINVLNYYLELFKKAGVE